VSDLTQRTIVTPEGVPLHLRVADLGERLGAFLIDVLIIVLSSMAVFFLTLFSSIALRGIALALWFLAFFAIRNFYFTWFECQWQGRTPGKRALGLRVIDAQGGILTTEAVFARNLMREVEFFLPLVAALAPQALLPDVPAWMRYASLAWLLVFALLPFFNRDRLRPGDLVGGTLVIRTPEAQLREDMSAAGADGAEIAFSAEQLDLYGVKELQVLESLLRRETRPDALEAVARQIQRKIGWSEAEPRVETGRFLRAFYTAQRARLEQRLLFGERRETKRAGRLTRKR
jgi:uncharacterized RDD family membrane protein YckC